MSRFASVRTSLPGPKSRSLLERKEQAISSAIGIHLPAAVERAAGALLHDVDGNTFIDLSGGVGCLNVGHSHPKVVRAIQAQAARYTHTDFSVAPYESYVRLCETLCRLAPGPRAKKAILLNSGTEAVENAVKIARAVTGRPAVIAFEGAFHGRTYMSLSLTSKIDPYKRNFGPFMADVYRTPFPDPYRAPDGDPTAWALVPRAYTAYLRHPADDFYLVLVDRRGPAVAVETLPWYDETYDKGYQGVIGVTEVPDADLLIVCVQRDSEPVLWDPVARRVVRKLRLAGRLGNPTCRFRRTAPELWVDDYDMLLRVDPVDWSVTGTRGLQRAARGARQFIGAFAFNRDETLCAVARPFSGDVLAVDTRRLRVTHRARVGRQPLEVALLADGRVFARDWRTGDLLSGRLRRRLLTLP